MIKRKSLFGLSINVMCLVIYSQAYTQNLSKENIKNEIEINGGALNFSLKGGGDQPFTIEYNDGRKAMLQVRELEPIQLEIPLKVEETSCSTFRPKTCTLNTEIIHSELSLLWTENPSLPERVNKHLVRIKNENDPIDEDYKLIEFNTIWSPEYQKMYPDIVKKIKSYELNCNDYRFLTGHKEDTTAPSSDLIIIDWANEFMDSNNETNINENRPVLGTMNAIFHKTSKNTLILKDVGQLTTKRDRGTKLLFIGDVIGWTLQPPLDKNLCEVTYKVNFSKVLILITELLREKEKKASFKPFIPNKDKFLWNEFLNDYSYVEDFNSIDEPYRTLLQLKLVQKSQHSLPQNDGTYKIKTLITPLQIR